ncbi:MAG: hypothetical protein AAF648_09380 [Pseudomonadota bacterium]
MSSLNEQFADLASTLRALIGLLDEADASFWVPYLKRGLLQVEAHKLAGATFVLGCYGGAETFSDLTIGEQFREAEPLRYRNLNARLNQLRTDCFEVANAIAARRHW